MTTQQPRFWTNDGGAIGSLSMWPFAQPDYMNPPAYRADTRERDAWLRDFVRQEPHLAGVVGQVGMIDKNRGWSLIGGKNSVIIYDRVLRMAENGEGWRRFMSRASLSFHTSNLGAVVETARDTIPGRLQGIYSVDHARCKTADGTGRLYYYPYRGGKRLDWNTNKIVQDNRGNSYMTPADYFRVVSLPTTDERLNGIGLCAVERCLRLAQLMMAVLDFDNEKLGSQAPKGLLMLHNISETQWVDALSSRKARNEGREQDWFGAVAVLASSGLEQMDAKLFALSQLPDGFDRYLFIEFLIYGYALAFGYDAGEFWPKMRGGLGHSVEVSTQHKKATGKGGLDFLLEMQTQLQLQLPNTVHFEFDQRDDEGRLIEAEVKKQMFSLIDGMYSSGLITIPEGRFLMAEAGLISHTWTESEEEIKVTDTNDELEDSEPIGSEQQNPAPIQQIRNGRAKTKMIQEVVREMPEAITSAEQFPNEPIIQIGFNPETGRRSLATIWASGAEMLQRKAWPGGAVSRVKRATLLQDEDVLITDDIVDRAVEKAIERVGDDIGDLINARLYSLQK